MFTRQAAAIILRDKSTVGDAEKRVMRLIHRRAAKMHVVGGHQRQLLGIGQVDQGRFGGALFAKSMALQFDIESAGKHYRQPVEQRRSCIRLPVEEQGVDRAAGTAGQRDQPLRMFAQQRRFDMRPVARLGLEIGGAEELGEVAISRLVLHQKRQVRRLLAAALMGRRRRHQLHRQKRADNGLDSGLGQGVGNFIDAEKVVAVGDGDGGHAALHRQRRQLLGPNRAFQQRISTFHPEMDERSHFAKASHGRGKSKENRRHYCASGPPCAATLRTIHNQRCVSTAWAPLARTKEDTMKMSKPAPAAASLSHMIAASPISAFVLFWFSASCKNKTRSNLPKQSSLFDRQGISN